MSDVIVGAGEQRATNALGIKVEPEDPKVEEQRLRYQCMSSAMQFASQMGFKTPEEIVRAANVFYDFIQSGKTVAKLEVVK